MIYITFNRYPLSWKIVRLKILTADILFNIFVVACPTFGFLVLALRAIPKKGAATLTTGIKKIFSKLFETP